MLNIDLSVWCMGRVYSTSVKHPWAAKSVPNCFPHFLILLNDGLYNPQNGLCQSALVVGGVAVVSGIRRCTVSRPPPLSACRFIRVVPVSRVVDGGVTATGVLSRERGNLITISITLY